MTIGGVTVSYNHSPDCFRYHMSQDLATGETMLWQVITYKHTLFVTATKTPILVLYFAVSIHNSCVDATLTKNKSFWFWCYK